MDRGKEISDCGNTNSITKANDIHTESTHNVDGYDDNMHDQHNNGSEGENKDDGQTSMMGKQLTVTTKKSWLTTTTKTFLQSKIAARWDKIIRCSCPHFPTSN